MAKYTCSLANGYTQSIDGSLLARDDAQLAAKHFVEGVWSSDLYVREDEYRVTVTDEHGGRWVYDVHVDGIELDLSVMLVDDER